MSDSLPPAVFETWLRSRGVSEVVPVGGGLSGAIVYRAAGDRAQRWAVRGWPPSVSGERVSEVHRVMRLARQAGCRWTPAVELAVVSGATRSWTIAAGRVWDCCEWMPGRPPGAHDDPAAVLRQTAAAVAQFHAAVSSLAPPPATAPPPIPVAAVKSRLQRLAELGPLLDPLLASRTFLSPLQGTASATQRALDCLRQVWASQRLRALRLLEPWTGIAFKQQYVFRDIHLGNVLFHEGRLSGIVDYDAVRIDSPATDLARLIGSVRLVLPPEAWDHSEETLWGEMLSVYREVGEFSTQEEQLSRVLAEVSPLISLANWLVWVVVERRSFPGPAAGVDERIEGWTRIMRHQFAVNLRNSAGFETR